MSCALQACMDGSRWQPLKQPCPSRHLRFPTGNFNIITLPWFWCSCVRCPYLLPKELAEKVTEVHLRALGAALNVLTQEQATSCR